MKTEIYDVLDKLLLQFGVRIDSSRSLFIEKAEIKRYSKNDIIFQENKRNNIEYLLLNGVIRRFILNEKGEIITLRFYMGATIITPHFLRTINEKSIYSLEALTDCLVAEIPVDELNTLYLSEQEFKTFRLRVIEQEFSNTLFNDITSRSLRAKERLLILRKNYRNLENLVSHHAIASYLGITNVSLSRLRASEKNMV
jgi:CRP-like cAMP-binding protein